jgi:hypothetical protein
MGIAELKKPAWEECPNVMAGVGCKIYAQRPPSCRQFICGWLLDPYMGPDLKPENCHVVFYQRSAQHIVATCDAAYPDAWRKPNVVEFLHRLAKANAPHRKVILMEKGRTWYVTETAIVPTDMGCVISAGERNQNRASARRRGGTPPRFQEGFHRIAPGAGLPN